MRIHRSFCWRELSKSDARVQEPDCKLLNMLAFHHKNNIGFDRDFV
jgi:hypothetical protein